MDFIPIVLSLVNRSVLVCWKKNYETHGAFNAVSYEELQRHGLFPSGANYLTSDDGIHFVPALKQIHCSENPSIYVDNDELIMYAGYGASGVWRAPDIDGPWKKEKSSLPLFANSSPVRNSTECPSIFERDGYKYILAGFTGYWQSGYRNDDFVDLAARGEDIYDGLCVPMVANCNGRYILAGWVAGLGWASVILHRELVWHEDGKAGIKWLSELTPSADDLSEVSFVDNVCANELFALDGRTSYYLQCTVKPQKDGKVGLAVCGNGKPFVFELNSARKKVQIKETSDPSDFTEEVKALCEYIPEMPEERLGFAQLPEDIHRYSRDFAIVNVRELEAEYTLKVIFHYEEKTDSLFVDAEIGGGRTFVSNRTYFRAESVKFLLHNAEVTNLKLGKLQQ